MSGFEIVVARRSLWRLKFFNFVLCLFLITCISKMLFADVRICNPIHILLAEVLPFRKIFFKQN